MSTPSRRAAGNARNLPAVPWPHAATGREGSGPKVRFHHYRAVYWAIPAGPFGGAYTPVVVHDDCFG